MAKHRGGKKRFYKKNGRTPAKKAYQEFCRAQLESSKSNNAQGVWIPTNMESLRARGLYGG